MPAPKSLSNYQDVQELFDRALAEGELVIQCKDYSDAVVLRHRCNYFRKLDRQSMADIYPVGDPKHGVSTYESIKLVIPKKGDPLDNILTLSVRSAADFKVLTKEEAAALRAGLKL